MRINPEPEPEKKCLLSGQDDGDDQAACELLEARASLTALCSSGLEEALHAG